MSGERQTGSKLAAALDMSWKEMSWLLMGLLTAIALHAAPNVTWLGTFPEHWNLPIAAWTNAVLAPVVVGLQGATRILSQIIGAPMSMRPRVALLDTVEHGDIGIFPSRVLDSGPSHSVFHTGIVPVHRLRWLLDADDEHDCSDRPSHPHCHSVGLCHRNSRGSLPPLEHSYASLPILCRRFRRSHILFRFCCCSALVQL